MFGNIINKIRLINKNYKKDTGRANIAETFMRYAIGAIFAFNFFLLFFETINHYIIENEMRRITVSLVVNIEQYGTISTALQNEYAIRYNKLKYFTGSYNIKYVVGHYDGANFTNTVIGTSVDGVSIGDKTVAKGDTIRVVAYSASNDGLGKLLNYLRADTTGTIRSRTAVSSEGVVW